jgi:hypothetical protein
VTEKTATAIEGLAVLRNLAANTDVGTTMDRATEYLTMTEGVLYAIENPPSTTAVVRDLWSGWLVGAGSGWFGRGVGVGVSRSTSAAGVAGLVSVRG